MAKKLINTSTSLNLNLNENKSKLDNLQNGELVVQSSKAGELKIWGRTLGGEVVSLPNTEDVNTMVDEKLKSLDISSKLEGLVHIEDLNTINGQKLYNTDGKPIDIEITGGSVTDEQLSEYAKTEDVTKALNKKANVDEVYSKDNMNILLGSKVDEGNVYSKEEINTELSKKADKIYTYSKDEVNELVSTIPTFDIEVVESLPVENISETTLYLLKFNESEDGALFSINIYSKGEWTELGKQTINFSDYYTKGETENVINDAIAEELQNYYNQAYINSLLAQKLSVSAFTAFQNNVYTKTQVDDIINGIEISGGTITEEQLENLVQKDSLKTINGHSLVLTGVEGEETDIEIKVSEIDTENLKNTFVEKKVYEQDKEDLEESITSKVDTTVFDAKTKTIDSTLEKKADKTYVTDYVQASLATTESYGMVVIPETVYEELVKNGQTYWNDVLLTYNENNIYFLYDETEEPEMPEEPVEPEQPTPEEPGNDEQAPENNGDESSEPNEMI